MSAVPAWKQAILDRKKKAEEEERKKQEKEAAYLASLPPWKRALVKKQREQQPTTPTLERKDSKEKSHPMPAVSSSSSTSADPSTKWMAAMQKARESPTLSRRGTWGASAAATSSSKNTTTPSIAKTQASSTRAFGDPLSSFSTKKPITTINSVKPPSSPDSPKLSSSPKWIQLAKSPQLSTRFAKLNNSPSKTEEQISIPSKDLLELSSSPETSGGVYLRSKPTEPAVQVSEKRKSFEGTEDEDAKLAAMPAWKKAIILRRKAQQNQEQSQPKTQASPAPQKKQQKQSQPATQVSPAPQKKHPSNEPASSVPKQIRQEKETPNVVAQSPVQTRKGEDEVGSPLTLRSSHKGSYTVTPAKASTHKDNYAPEKTSSHKESYLSTKTSASKESYTPPKASASKAPTKTSTSNSSTTTSTNRDSRKATKTSTKKESHTPTRSSGKKEAKAAKSEETPSPRAQKKEQKVPASKSPSAKPITNKKTQSQGNTTVKRQPEIVNRPQADSEGPTKLVEQEGTVLRPPVYKEVDEWANVTENDPSFKKLPLWKQALIKRRRNDIVKRSAPPPPEQPASDKQKSSSNRETQNTPKWNVQTLNKSMEKNKSPHTSTSQGSNKLQPVRKAPTRPEPTRSAPPPPKQEKEEPMFTYSFSKNRLDAGSESENSDSDLEDVQVTNLDESEDEDSGIDKGAIVVMSYKVTNSEYAPPTSPTKTESHGIPRSESKPILVDPSKKSYKVSIPLNLFNHNFCIVSEMQIMTFLFVCFFLVETASCVIQRQQSHRGALLP